MVTSSAETQGERRLAMVNGQLRTSNVVDQEVLAAFLATRRERFVAPNFVPLAYVDREVPALGAKRRQLLAPRTLERMLQAATVNRGHRPLYVCGGSRHSTERS